MFRRKSTNYVSDIDKFIDEFNRTHPKSESQLAEMKKYERLNALRDHPHALEKEDIWK